MDKVCRPSNTIGRKQYPAIDIAKIFFCVCIVALHTGADMVLPQPLGYLVNKSVCRLAVPFFFVAAGFLFAQKIIMENFAEKDLKKNILNQCKRLLKPLIVFEALNVLLIVVECFLNKEMTVMYAIGICKYIVFYPYGALWYVQASIVALALLYPFLKKKCINGAIVLGFFLYVFALLCNNYYFLAEKLGIEGFVDLYIDMFISARNGVFTGFFSIALGIKCAQLCAKGIKKKNLYILFTVSFTLYVAEITFIATKQNVADDGALYISHIILLPCLVAILSNIKLKPSRAYVLMRNYSSGIYFLHRIFIKLLSMIFAEKLNPIIAFVAVLVICATICSVTYKTKKEPFYSLLK